MPQSYDASFLFDGLPHLAECKEDYQGRKDKVVKKEPIKDPDLMEWHDMIENPGIYKVIDPRDERLHKTLRVISMRTEAGMPVVLLKDTRTGEFKALDKWERVQYKRIKDTLTHIFRF